MVKVYENHLMKGGFYIFIIGISEYKTGDFTSVPAPALSAYYLYRVLKYLAENNRLPIASISILLSPTDSEKNTYPSLKNFINLHSNKIEATKENFVRDSKSFYKDKKIPPEATTLFYCCGHGVQRSIPNYDQLLIFPDFTFADWQDQCFPLYVLPNIATKKNPAKNHLFFFDTCRNMLGSEAGEEIVEEEMSVSENTPNHPWSYNPKRDSKIRRNCHIFQSAVAGEQLEVEHFRPTILVLSMCAALKGAALTRIDKNENEEPWYMSSHSLAQSIRNHMIWYEPLLNENFNESDSSFQSIGESTGPNFKILEWEVKRKLPKCRLDIFLLNPKNHQGVTLNIETLVFPYTKTKQLKKMCLKTFCYILKLEPGYFIITPKLPKNCIPPKYIKEVRPAEIYPTRIRITFK